MPSADTVKTLDGIEPASALAEAFETIPLGGLKIKRDLKPGMLVHVDGIETTYKTLNGRQCMLIDYISQGKHDGYWNAYCPTATEDSKHRKNRKIFRIRQGKMSFVDEIAPFTFNDGMATYKTDMDLLNDSSEFHEGLKVLVTESAQPGAYFQVCTLSKLLE